MTNTSDVLSEIETGLMTAEKAIPMLSGILAMIPGASAIVPFLQLIPVAAEAVAKIQEVSGTSQSGAITVLRSHMTAGMPNSSALGPSASTQGSA